MIGDAPPFPSRIARALSNSVRQMPAGASSTQPATMVDTQDYAIPYGASLGILARATGTSLIRYTSAPRRPLLVSRLQAARVASAD